MDIEKKISSLAKELPGETQVTAINLSDVSRDINRPEGITKYLGTKADTKEIKISDIELLPEYAFILKAVREKCPAIFVTGKAGTGKSTLIRFLVSKIEKSAVIAPTSIAAINVGGSTIHSFFGIPPRIINPDEAFNPKKQMIPVIENLDVLIIDEVSMVSPDIVDCISNSLQRSKRNDIPFGGIPIIFVGDILQLPPVVTDRNAGIYYTHRYDSPYFYSAEVFRNIEIIPIELTKVFRQKDSDFISALDHIRTNSEHRDSVALFNRKCYRDKEKTDSDDLCLVPTNAAAKSINENRLDKISSEMISFDAVYSDGLDAGKIKFPAPDRLNLKNGAKIIFVKNNYPLWLNGTIGEVISIETESIRVKIAETGNIVPVSRETWEKLRYRYNYEEKRIESEIIGTFSQFPISLGWAITIHKSQGMTIETLRIDLGRGAFCFGQTYVALSRCRTIEGITLIKPISMSDVKADTTVIEFYKKLGFLKDDPVPLTKPSTSS